MGRVTLRRKVTKVRVADQPDATSQTDGASADPPADVRREVSDTLVIEEPLEIRIGGQAISVTMRTPGDDFDLVCGFLVGEGAVHRADQIAAMRFCAGADGQQPDTDEQLNTLNVIDVTTDGTVEIAGLQRNFYATSSCGVCGKASIDTIRAVAHHTPGDGPVLEPRVVVTLPGALRAAQRVFDRTGGLHAAGLFTATGDLLVLREDVGRHNAVDKVVGWALRDGRLPLHDTILQVSGRASFELVQKAALAGIPVLSAVSAPSSLAVELAEEVGMTLLGFVRPPTFNVYAGGRRLRNVSAADSVAPA